MQSSSSLRVDLSVIHNNLKRLTATFGHVMVMVKANAYGTDPLLLSKFLKLGKWREIPFLGVSHVWEGIRLRQAGITTPIFVIAAPPYEAETVAYYQLTCAASSLEEVESLNLAAKKYGKKLPLHLHLDTGMNRFGVSKHFATTLYQAIRNASHLHLEGIMTHFAAAESPAFDPFTQEQIRAFKQFVDSLPALPRWIHAANSAGAVRFPLPFCNLVRIGLGVMGYGICLEGVEPAFSFTTLLASITSGEKGESVGYHCTYKIEKERARIGVIPVGYHDGFHRSLSGKGYVLIRGKKAPMIGVICMDFMMIDLTDIPEAQVGDEVQLFGPGLSIETLAKWAKTDVRELLVSLPPRVERLWINPPLLIHATRNENATSTTRVRSPFLTIKKDPSSG
jgi:Alr-MurF fusion protein